MYLLIQPNDASYINTYKIRVTGSLTESPSYNNFTEFSFEIRRNYPPVPMDFVKSAILYAHHN